MSNIYQVASEAGVSVATVSRVFSGSANVNAELRERVRDVAQRLGYQPNPVARALATGRANVIGIVIPIGGANPYYSTLTHHVARSAWQRGYEVVAASPPEWTPDAFRALLRTFRERMMDGIMAWGWDLTDDEWAAWDGPPVVLLGGLGSRPIPVVCPDEETGGLVATRHLLELGHRSIAFLCMSVDGPRWRGRESGYAEAMRAAGLAPSFHHGPASLEGGRTAAKELLARDPSVTALVAHNDEAALGAIRGLWEIGLRVPEDVSVVGFDNTPVGAFGIPSLTSVDYSVEELAFLATETLLAAVTVRSPQGSAPHIAVRPRLEARESSAPPRAIP